MNKNQEQAKQSNLKNSREGLHLQLNDVFMRNKLSTLEYEMVRAINSKDVQFFQDLGCLEETDLNFELTSDGIFPLMLASALGLQVGSSSVRKSIVVMMLHNHSIQIDKTDKFGINAFWIAACKGHVHVRKTFENQILECLSQAKINIYQRDTNGRSALHIAAKNGHMPVVEHLVRVHKMDPNIPCDDGRTPLIFATKCEKPDLVSFLIKYGSEINVETRSGMTPLLIATKMNSKIMVKILVEKGGAEINMARPPKNITALLIAVSNGSVELVNYFCDRSADISQKLSNNTNVVMLACWKGYVEVLRVLCTVLLRRGSQRVLSYENAINGYTALTYALLSEHFDCAEILLRLKLVYRGSQLSVREKEKKQLADGLSIGLNRRAEEQELREDQLQAVVDINQRSSKDLNTTLHFCVMKRKTAAITFLVERGADIHLKNKQNLSPKMLAEVIKFHHPSLTGPSRQESANLFRESSGTHTPIFHQLVSFGAKALQNHVHELQQQNQERREELHKKVEFIKSEEVNRQPEDENADNEVEGESKREESKEEGSPKKEEHSVIQRVKTAAVLDAFYEGDDEQQSEYESKSDIGSDHQRFSQFSFSLEFKKSSYNGDGSETKNGSKTTKRFKTRRKLLSYKQSSNSAATGVFPCMAQPQAPVSEFKAQPTKNAPTEAEINSTSSKILEDISEEQPSRSFSTQGVCSRGKKEPKKQSQFSSIRDSKLSLQKNDTELNSFDFSKEQPPPVYLDKPDAPNSSDQIPRSGGVKSSSGESQNPTEEGSKKAGTGGPDPQSDSEQSFEAPILPQNPEAVLSPVQEQKNRENLLTEPADNEVPHALSLREQSDKEALQLGKVGTHKSDQNLQIYYSHQKEEKAVNSYRDDEMADESHDSVATVRSEEQMNQSQKKREETSELKERPVEDRSRRCSTLQNMSYLGSCLEEEEQNKIGSLAQSSRFSSPVNLELVQKIVRNDRKLKAKKQGSLPMERNGARNTEEEEQNQRSDQVNFHVEYKPPLLKESKPIQKKKSTRIEPEGEDPIPSSPPFQSKPVPLEFHIESEEVHKVEESQIQKSLDTGESKMKRIDLSLKTKEEESESNTDAPPQKSKFKYRKSTDLQSRVLLSPKVLPLTDGASQRLQQKAMIQVKNTGELNEQPEEAIAAERKARVPSPLKIMDQEIKGIAKLKIPVEAPKIPQKTTLGEIRSAKHVKHKSELPGSLSNLSPSKNLNLLAGILSPYINVKVQQQSEDKKKRDVKSIYSDYRIKSKQFVKTLKPGSIRLPALQTEEQENQLAFSSKQSSHNNSVDISPLRSKFIATYATPKRGLNLDAKARLSPRKDASPLFIPQNKANLLSQIENRGQSVMERFQKIERARISPISIGRAFNNTILEERVEQRRNQLKLGQELRSKIAVNLFKGDESKLGGKPKIPQLAGLGGKEHQI